MRTLEAMTRDELIEIVKAQSIFTYALRKVSNEALSHANHIVSNYCKRVPTDKMHAYTRAQVDASALLILPAPVTPEPVEH